MQIKEVLRILEEMAPLAYAEDFDNVGLLVGDAQAELTGLLIAHDALEEVIDEAIALGHNLVVCFHPIVFSGLKTLTGKDYVQRSVIKAIKHDIAIYAVHTALDNHREGVNQIMCDQLGLVNSRILLPKKRFIQKLVTYAPASCAATVLEAMHLAGAGQIGNYSDCSFQSVGVGSYRPQPGSTPAIGQIGQLEQGEEIRLEVTFEAYKQAAILQALRTAHIYEEVAYEVYQTENEHQQIGLGMLAELPEEMSETEFLHHVKAVMQADGIRHTALRGKPVRKVAVLGGSGAFAIAAAKAAGADALVTSDLKYHDFYQAEGQLILLDIGHFESERYTKNYIGEFLKKKITNFAISLSKVNTNPVKYI